MLSVTVGGPGLVAVGTAGTGAADADRWGTVDPRDELDAAVWKWGN